MAVRLITSEMADRLLMYLKDNYNPGHTFGISDVKTVCEATGLEFNELHALLEGFDREGLIHCTNIRQVFIELRVYIKLHRFIETGGFSGELARLKAELDVLKATLEKPLAEKAETLTGIIANVTALIGNVTSGLLGKY